jgi:alkanesulfonate monooxygenase SsuD/methylene tetrahydromethanopterin reductase-like flavin-dependent oxidoreductase (luciferase family)
MAKAATTLDEISNGRFTLGVGTGWMESEHEAFGMDLPPLGERFDRLAEALAYIRTVFDGGGTVEGEYYSLSAPWVSPAASDGLRIVIGGEGMVKTPTLAGRFADEYNMFVTDPETIGRRVTVMRQAAEAAGRDPDAILISMAGPGFVYPNEMGHLKALTTRGAKKGMSPSEYAVFLDERLVPHGPPSRARNAIQRMENLGIGRYYVQEMSSLEDIDLERMNRVFEALQGA